MNNLAAEYIPYSAVHNCSTAASFIKQVMSHDLQYFFNNFAEKMRHDVSCE